jgi:KaiC/GvpD/RAD55 family RecA-like ATPase
MVVDSGSPILDQILRGGLPTGRAVLVTGTPGTGKSTLAMQFLQAGLDRGDACLFISTEQTADELRDSFEPFAFDLDHEGLTIASIRVRRGRTLKSDEPELVVEPLGDESSVGGGFNVPFTSDHLREVLSEYASYDRVVLDSVSGLEPMADTQTEFRREVVDLIQMFTHEFEATTVLTSEYVEDAPRRHSADVVASENAVQYNVHGVIRLWRERIEGELRRFVDVMKMRGVDHDTRQFEVAFADDGLEVIPREHSLPATLSTRERLETGIDGFDELLGGGLLKGTSVLLEHDGRASIEPLMYAVATCGLERGMDLVFVPRVNTPEAHLDELISRAAIPADDTDALLESNRLFVLDTLGAWSERRNVFNLEYEDGGIGYLLETVADRAAGEGILFISNTEALAHAMDVDENRHLRYWVLAQFISDSDLLFDVHNPDLMDDTLADFYIDAATQSIRTWIHDNGLQYVKLQKSPTGEVGALRLVEYADEPPYVRLE